MPYVKLKRRSKRFKFMKSVKTTLFIVLISSAIGMAAVFLSDLWFPRASSSSSLSSSLSSNAPDTESSIINKYKDNYGDDWKNKLKEDYQAYSKGMR